MNMLTNLTRIERRNSGYPTSDGRPMAETDTHRELMIDTIGTLDDFYAADPLVYVSGNLLVYHERGDRLRHVSPDTFVVKGVPKRKRDYYNPATGQLLPTRTEKLAQAEAENARLRRELEKLRRQLPGQ